MNGSPSIGGVGPAGFGLTDRDRGFVTHGRVIRGAATALYYCMGETTDSPFGGERGLLAGPRRQAIFAWRGRVHSVPYATEILNGLTHGVSGFQFYVDTSTNLIDANGISTGANPSASTLYYAYMNPEGTLRLSATAPSFYEGRKVLSATAEGRNWVFLAFAYTNASTQFEDDDDGRHVANYYNRVRKRLFTCPAYSNGGTETSYSHTNTAYAAANAGTGATVSYIHNGEDCPEFTVHASADAPVGNNSFCGLGDNSTTTAAAAMLINPASDRHTVSLRYAVDSGTPARRTASILFATVGGTLVVYADGERRSGTTDPYATYLIGSVLV